MEDHRGSLLGAVLTAFVLCLALLPAVAASATVGTMQVAADTTLTEDHTGPIEIVGDNITLDCAGHMVVGFGYGVGIALSDRSGVTVRNCNVHGFESGFRLLRSTGNTLTDSTAGGNSEFGFLLSEGSDANVLSRNVAERNGVAGFEVDHSSGNTIDMNRAIANDTAEPWVVTSAGFRITESDGNTITRNSAEDNETGFFVWLESASGNVFIDNDAHRNRTLGFHDTTMGGSGDGGTDNEYGDNYCTGHWGMGSLPGHFCTEEQVGLVETSTGEWHLRHTDFDVTSFYYGNPGDVPFLGDWDCDGVATPGLFRTSDTYAYLRNTNTQGIADIRFFFGNPSDIPLAGDFNGDGCDTLSIYRPSEARFYIVNKLGENEGGLGAAEYSFLFGNPGDKPVVGDWDGDGIDEIGLHRETAGFFYYRNTLTTGIADGQFYFGDPGDKFVAGDWGVVDGVETPALFRHADSTFFFRNTLTQGNADSQFRQPGPGPDWVPVSGDFELDLAGRQPRSWPGG